MKRTLKSTKKRAWTAFSRYIRHKYSKEGMCECYTCGDVKPIEEMQAGHGIAGRTNSVLFLEEVVRPQCPRCNIFRNGMYEVFIPKLIEEYGLDGYYEFVRIKNTPKKFTIEELERLIEEWTI